MPGRLKYCPTSIDHMINIEWSIISRTFILSNKNLFFGIESSVLNRKRNTEWKPKLKRRIGQGFPCI